MTLHHVYSGKVRDIYAVDAETLLFVASDRLSAFDVILDEPIPNKGRVLTGMTAFWLDQLRDVAPSHLVAVDPADFPPDVAEMPDVAGRAMLVRKAEMLKIECIVRGYLTGTAIKQYRLDGTIHGVKLPDGLVEASKLPEPMFTTSTKVDGGHDVNISFDEACEIVGRDVAERARDLSLACYAKAADRAAERGIIIADTKFELGFIAGELSLCDEVLTPDSSRFWPADQWEPGKVTPSFDKQPLRDWLEETGWDKTPPPPALPEEVVAATAQRYATAYERITGLRLSEWHGMDQDSSIEEERT